MLTSGPKCVDVVAGGTAVGRRPSSLEEIHQREVDPLSGQGVDDPRAAGRPDRLPAAAVDLNRRAADETSRRAGGRRVARHSAPVTATLPGGRRRRRRLVVGRAALAGH